MTLTPVNTGVKIDNKTLGYNDSAELEIKGGGVGFSLLDDGVLKHIKLEQTNNISCTNSTSFRNFFNNYNVEESGVYLIIADITLRRWSNPDNGDDFNFNLRCMVNNSVVKNTQNRQDIGSNDNVKPYVTLNMLHVQALTTEDNLNFEFNQGASNGEGCCVEETGTVHLIKIGDIN